MRAQPLGPLSLALMALLLALAVNVGVGTMVESFRRTFLGYLDQRLAAELYVTARRRCRGGGDRRLARRPARRSPRCCRSAAPRTRVGDWPVEVYGFRDHATYRDELAAARRRRPDAWDRVARGAGGAGLRAARPALRALAGRDADAAGAGRRLDAAGGRRSTPTTAMPRAR